MKNLLFILALGTAASAAFGQSDNDDLYYNARDRKTEIAQRPRVNTYTNETAERLSSTPSPAFEGQYSGRAINPDYNPADDDVYEGDAAYFNPDYAPLAVNGNLYSNPIGNPYAYNRIGHPGMQPFGSAWGYNNWGWNSFYDPFSSWNSFGGWGGGFSPWYRSGCISCWSVTSSFGWGNSSWSQSSFGWGGFGGPTFGFGGWNSWNSWNNPVIGHVNGYDRQPRLTYGRRPSRSTNYANDAREPVRRNNVIIGGETNRSYTNSRTAGNDNRNYYQRGWRQDPAINPQRPSTGSSVPSKWGQSSGWNNSTFDRSGSEQSNWRSNSPSRSFSSPSSGFGGGSRSGGSGSGGGSSSGGRRGRN